MTLAKHPLKTLTLAAGIALAAPGAFAQAFDAVRLYGAAPGKDGGTVGAALATVPQYLGSDERRTLVLPVLDYQWANGWFAGITNGIGYNFSTSSQMQYGLRLTADAGRKQNRADALNGMGDVDGAAEGGAFFNYLLPQGLFLSSSLRHGSGGQHKGLVVDLGVGYATAIAPKWHLAVGAALTLANADYLQAFFGVTNAQSGASGYAAYTPGAGARDLRANLALSYAIDPKISVTAALSASSLLGAAKDSPLTRQRTSGSAILGMAFAF